MSKNTKRTSSEIASLAGQVLQNPAASGIQKQLAGAALSQRSPAKQTGPQLEDIASKVLSSPKYSDLTKTLAGTVLSQSNKER